MPAMPSKHRNPKCCDACAGKVKLIQREDDNEDVIVERLEIYYSQVHAILDYYDDLEKICFFEPKKGVADYPLMLESVI